MELSLVSILVNRAPHCVCRFNNGMVGGAEKGEAKGG